LRARAARLASAALAVVAAFTTLAPPVDAQQQVYSADRVKAAFLYHFTTYVNWPADVLEDDVFTIAVLGSDSVAEELSEYLPGHTIQGRPMEVRQVRSVGELDEEEVLYIGPRENRRLNEHLAQLAARPMLVVTDDPDGLRNGAVINFRIVDERVRFEISLRSAQQAGLELSSRLLSAAMSVEAAGAILELDGNVAALDRHAAP
jgi:hypothetical protein